MIQIWDRKYVVRIFKKKNILTCFKKVNRCTLSKFINILILIFLGSRKQRWFADPAGKKKKQPYSGLKSFNFSWCAWVLLTHQLVEDKYLPTVGWTLDSWHLWSNFITRLQQFKKFHPISQGQLVMADECQHYQQLHSLAMNWTNVHGVPLKSS